MREIEIKVRVRDEVSLLARLKEQVITLGDAVKQHDVVYAQPGYKDNDPAANWLRIRTENDSRIIFTLKRSVVGHLDSIEHETAVESAAELEAIIKQLGFELYSDLTKIRRKGHLGDMELCLDEVPGLGTFIEAEKLMDDSADHDTVVAELWQVLTSLGLDKKDEEQLGYDVMERAKRHLHSA
jgi:adenylate cyclase class 2